MRTWLGGVAKFCKEYSKIESNSSSYILYRVKSPILLVSTGGYIFFFSFLGWYIRRSETSASGREAWEAEEEKAERGNDGEEKGPVPREERQQRSGQREQGAEREQEELAEPEQNPKQRVK